MRPASRIFGCIISLPPAVLQSVAQQSILFYGLAELAGTFTTGIMTYLNKLEPHNLCDGYATSMERQWAARSLAVRP